VQAAIPPSLKVLGKHYWERGETLSRMIDSYRFGRIVVDGVEYTRDLIILPGRVEGGWWREEGHRLGLGDLGEALAAEPEALSLLLEGQPSHGPSHGEWVLNPGMFFQVEPGLTLGRARVHTEDSFVVTDGGARNVSEYRDVSEIQRIR